MKPFVIIQLRPEDETSDSEYQCILKKGNLQPEETYRIRAEKNGIPELNLNQYSGIIIGGSPFDVTTPENEKSPNQLQFEKDIQRLLNKVIEQDFPFIGCCSGNGLLGRHCGGTISRKYPEPVCAVDITLTEAGLKDPLCKDLPKTFRGLVGHKECCEVLPTQAVHLASSPTCPVQMFRIKQNIYATQFHPEADPEEFVLRINIYKNHGYFPASQAQELINAVKGEHITYPETVLQNFISKYKR